MNKDLLEKLVNKGLEKGADFSEIFYEDKKELSMLFSSKILEKCTINKTKGMGIRLAKDTEVYYFDTNNLDEKHLIDSIEKLNHNFDGNRIISDINLVLQPKIQKYIEKDYTVENLKEIKDKFYEYDKYARSLDDRVIQFIIELSGTKQNVTIANSKGKLVNDERILTKFYFKIIVKDRERSEFASVNFGYGKGLEIVEDEKIYALIKERVNDALEKLHAIPSPGGELPVVLSSQGGVLMHEACGHAMEATMLADGTSILSDKLNTKVASSKVTIIDDGTIEDEWGSTNYDDEGNKTKRNVLIENGVLKKFLIDEISTKMMDGEISGSGRRNDFTYAPTSRMNNTYLDKGTDSVEDMIKSIKYGLYAKTLGGGQVDPSTGDFTFGVLDAYMIRDGKIAESVKGASLVGNTMEVLNQIEMVSDDLELCAGYCGSISGWVPVTTGQPTVKIGKILVGGEANAK